MDIECGYTYIIVWEASRTAQAVLCQRIADVRITEYYLEEGQTTKQRNKDGV